VLLNQHPTLSKLFKFFTHTQTCIQIVLLCLKFYSPIIARIQVLNKPMNHKRNLASTYTYCSLMRFRILNVKYETPKQLPKQNKQKKTLLTFNWVTPMINN
jgi:hypothetical protein